jgi:hypothetical protein
MVFIDRPPDPLFVNRAVQHCAVQHGVDAPMLVARTGWRDHR